MNKKNATIMGIIGLVLLLYFFRESNEYSKTSSLKDSNYYLTSPWVTERVDWFFIQLPAKWTENFKEIKKSKSAYDEISNEVHLYEMNLKDFYLISSFFDAKDGIGENWDLDKSATAMINEALYNLKCEDIIIEKLEPFNNNQLVNYSALSSCSPTNFKARMRGIKYRNKIFIVLLFYNPSDNNNEIIANRIIDSIEDKYPEVENIKN